MDRHPDIFSPREAAEYLHIDTSDEGWERTMQTIRDVHQLTGQKIGRTFFYHRRQLDAVVDRIFGVVQQKPLTNSTGPYRKTG